MIETETEKGNNWNVIVFKVKNSNFQNIMTHLFDFCENDPEIQIPHFTMRCFDLNKFIIISFRVFRKIDSSNAVEKRLYDYMNSLDVENFSIDPDLNHEYKKYHAWIGKSSINEHWNRKRCDILHILSKTVIESIKLGVFDYEDRSEWCHLLINMMCLQEGVQKGNVRFLDALTGYSNIGYKTRLLP